MSNILRKALVGVNDNDILFEMTANAEEYDTWQVGSTAGSIDVVVSGDGTNYGTTVVAMEDLGAAASGTRVLSTTANGNYVFRGRYRKIKVMQNGATAVANGYLLGWNAAQ